MDIEKLIKDPQFSNYVCVDIGLAFGGQCLEKYTRHGLEQVHEKIKSSSSLAGHAPCSQQCKAVDKYTTRWCTTCKYWQKQLNKYYRGNDVDWTNQEPWKWPKTYENFVNIFVKAPVKSVGSVNLRDLSNACSIWTRCKMFNLKEIVLNNVKHCRNEFFAHNDTRRVTDIDKARVFDSLRDLLRDQDVQPFIDSQECLKQLEKKEKSDEFLREIIRDHEAYRTALVGGNKEVLENLTKTLTEVYKDAKSLKYSQDDVITAIQSTNEIVTLLYERQSQENIDRESFQNYTLSILHDIDVRTKKIALWLGTAFVTVLCGIVFIAMYFNKYDTLRDHSFNMNGADRANRSRHIYSKCLSEAYTYPFRQDLPLLGYLPTQNELIGREWALEILEQKLLDENTNSRGVLMTADFGFGKSAIVAHLLCVSENMKGWNIKKHLVAFHVCKSNVGLTKRPARLIRRLIGFLSMKSAEYGQYIALHEYSLMFNESDCEKNIDACFDQAITIPLETLTPPDDAPWIIAIDALDECQEPDGTNPILELLSNRIIFVQPRGRKWFRWIVTSRQMNALTTLSKFDIVDFKSRDQRNTNDIRHLIINHLPSAQTYQHLAESFAINSGGNTLYVRLALEHAIQSKNLSLPYLLKLPVTMEEIYELNFDRLFENNNDFQAAKPILEIICIGQFKLARIFEILTENEVVDRKHLEKVIDRLSYFILTDNIVTFRHISLHDWLKKNSKYKVSIERGHAMVATYMLNSFSSEYFSMEDCYFLKLVDHVAKSEDTNLFNKFRSGHFTYFQEFTQDLNKFLGFNSYSMKFCRNNKLSLKSLELLLDFMNKTIHGDIANVILENIFFLARDNLDIFKFLFKKVSHLKQSFLLHRAAKHCKEEIARYLITEANQSVLLEDMQGNRPSDIACVYGCITVLKLIAEKDHSVLDMECLYRALVFGKHNFNTIVNEVEFHVSCSQRTYIVNEVEFHHSCSQRTYTDFITALFNDILFVGERGKALETFPTFFKISVLHVLIHSHSQFYIHNLLSEVCRIPDSVWDENIKNVGITELFRTLLPSEGQILSELNQVDFYLKNRDNLKRNSYSFNTFIDKYPEILSCPDAQGFTPALLIVVLNKYDLLPAVLGHAIKDRCQKVSPVMAYIFWYITERHRCVPFIEYPYSGWCWHSRKFSCPIHASFEHLLMRYERARMIDLVIANGYTLDWNKKDIHGKTPLDYAKPEFIRQLENHFGVNIQILSDKDRLVQLCVLDWSDFLLFSYIFTGVCFVIGLHVLAYYAVLNVVYSVLLSFQNIRQTY